MTGFWRTALGSIAAAILLGVPAGAQVAAQANGGYKTEPARANIARGLSSPHRDREQRPRELVAALRLSPGMTVADLGTGVGYMLPWLSRAVSPGGAVIAEDIFPDFLDKARETARHESLKNVSFLLGTDRDTRLPAACCDLVMALDAYHHFDYPGDMLASVARGLKPGGRFAIIDYYRRPDAMPGGRAMDHIRLDRDEVIKEVEGFGWKCTWRGDHNPKSQYIAIFEKR